MSRLHRESFPGASQWMVPFMLKNNRSTFRQFFFSMFCHPSMETPSIAAVFLVIFFDRFEAEHFLRMTSPTVCGVETWYDLWTELP